MSDHYTFVTQVIFNDEEKAKRVEISLTQAAGEYTLTFVRLQTSGGNPFFAGHFKNSGGGPWPEIFTFDDPIVEVVVMRNDGAVFKDVDGTHQALPH